MTLDFLFGSLPFSAFDTRVDTPVDTRNDTPVDTLTEKSIYAIPQVKHSSPQAQTETQEFGLMGNRSFFVFQTRLFSDLRPSTRDPFFTQMGVISKTMLVESLG